MCIYSAAAVHRVCIRSHGDGGALAEDFSSRRWDGGAAGRRGWGLRDGGTHTGSEDMVAEVVSVMCCESVSRRRWAVVVGEVFGWWLPLEVLVGKVMSIGGGASNVGPGWLAGRAFGGIR